MIRRLRRRHLIFGPAVLALAPLGLILGVLNRPSEPDPIGLPVPRPDVALARVPGLPVEVETVARSAAAVTLVVRATEWLQWPDPLLYWSPSPPVGDSLPEGARFVAPLSRRTAAARFDRGELASGGTLLVVDGARRRVVKTAPAPPSIAEASR